MSDALTDIARDERRATLYGKYLESLADYLEDKSNEKYQILEDIAERTDAVPRGYWGRSTTFSHGLKKYVGELYGGNRKAWIKLLDSISQNGFRDYPSYKRLKKLSPIKDEVFISVDYGRGFSTIDWGEFEDMIHKKIKEEDFKLFDGDKYILAISKDDLEKILSKAKVEWLGCRIFGVPRDKKGNPKN